MPWQETSPMDLRSQFVREFASGSFTMTELAEAYRIAPKTGTVGSTAMPRAGCSRWRMGRAPARLSTCHAGQRDASAGAGTPSASHVGGAQLLAWLRRRDPTTVWPASSTACALLQQAGLVRTRRGSPSACRAGVAAEYPRRAERSLDGRLQRRVSHRGCRLVLSVDGARRPPVGMCCASTR